MIEVTLSDEEIVENCRSSDFMKTYIGQKLRAAGVPMKSTCDLTAEPEITKGRLIMVRAHDRNYITYTWKDDDE